MTEIMVHSSVGESFSFSESKFNHIKSVNDPQMTVGDNNEIDENTVIFGDKMDAQSDKSSESTICGSNSNDSTLTGDIKDLSNSTIKSNIIHKNFEYVSTKTTVINTTYNVISKSAIRSLKEVPNVNPTSMVSSNNDKSRVIVQILTSDAKKSVKSQDIVENKSTNVEHQNTHSFRDDVFNILSKSQSSKIDIGSNTKEGIVIPDTIMKVSDAIQKVSSQSERKTQIDRNRRKRSLKSFFLFGEGPKISDIKEVSCNIEIATPNALRIVHYVLFDKYGLCNNALQVLQTKKNILNFCGYPFDQHSKEFAKRYNCLKKIPRPILYEVHQAVFGKSSINSRLLMVQQLMEFFLKPKKYNKIIDRMKQKMKFLVEEEYSALKEAALKGPLPFISLQRLEIVDIERMKNQLTNKPKKENPVEEQQVENPNLIPNDADDKFFHYSLPAYILKGPGKKLKCFPSIRRNVENADDTGISLLHYILYGRIESESVEVCRRNILEFSGFLKCQTEFIAERKATLIRLDQPELFQLCKILCLHGKTSSRVSRIKKIMEYLQAPRNPVQKRGIKHKEEHMHHKTLSKLEQMLSSPGEKISQVLQRKALSISNSVDVENDSGWRLRDFKTICSNIECSAPSDLTELNDLLFITPCDETEIHEKILKFTRFGFTEGSKDYQFRKTLLFYMGPCIIRKIARLLNIEYLDECSHQELSSSILSFLMKKKSSDLSHAQSSLVAVPKSFHDSITVKIPQSQEASFHSENVQRQTNEVITSRKERVFIHRLSKSSINSDVCSENETSLVSINTHGKKGGICSAEDDSIPLRVFIHHPTDLELQRVIYDIIKDNLWEITLGDLVQRVYDYYPDFNLFYRENFIKTEARQKLSELRTNAFNLVQQMSFNQTPM